jgi:hypothetical protein
MHMEARMPSQPPHHDGSAGVLPAVRPEHRLSTFPEPIPPGKQLGFTEPAKRREAAAPSVVTLRTFIA